ncbi:hypothetical protein GCM10009122_23200 [Fulvivirga kasyanovii]|uniref:Uncharacterized protein n=1 Tax=Fulvivirga kasyanovii TaxID=396812 RepID=A0ABW9RXH6_9BACT|nr:hypothetical protein [Fulvivirga kasyanovii]MTI28974.1 hypothetical protein [Fulvivirga kasyanovii]
MIIPVPSKGKRFVIRLGIAAWMPVAVGIRAYDPTRPNTHYFRRKVAFKGITDGTAFRGIEIPMPLSPELLEVEIYNKQTDDDEGFSIEKFEVEPMPPAQLWAKPDMHRFIEFAQKFAQRAGYARTGFHQDRDAEFLLHYLPEITDAIGRTMVTPARTHRATGRHQVSQKLFRQFTIPIRFFILLHERAHFTLPTREEKPADLEALKIYLELGFPKIEAVYAATKVFGLHPETIGEPHVTRTKDIMNFIDNYKKLKTA